MENINYNIISAIFHCTIIKHNINIKTNFKNKILIDQIQNDHYVYVCIYKNNLKNTIIN